MRSSPNGYRVAGYDINPYSPYRNHDALTEKWDAVTVWDVLEHMDDPFTFIRDLNTRYLFALTPDVGNIRVPVAEWAHYRPDEHQHCFSRNSLMKMMTRAGYEVMEFNYDEGGIRNPKAPLHLVSAVGCK